MKRPSLCKKPAADAAVLKKPSSKEHRWVWGAVEVGQIDGVPKSHASSDERVHLSLLAERSVAPDQKPREEKSIAQAMHDAILAGSRLVSDEWRATPVAARRADLEMEGTVNHSKTFRDPDTGVHSNDIESEFGRFELWMRKKFAYNRMGNQATEEKKRSEFHRKLVESMFYTNVERSMSCIMEAVRRSTT